jgi:two-component system sensor histidine kinase CpxA
MVGAVLQVTRAEGDGNVVRREQFDLHNLLMEIAEDCSVEAESYACSVNVSCPCELFAEADRELLRRAIENVLRNAIRYSPANSAIDVTGAADASRFTIEVRDYGPGVPEELLSRIFQPFYRVDESRDSKTGGVGLGLAIANRAVMVHKGQMTAHNAMPGLRVTITLPVKGQEETTSNNAIAVRETAI